MDLPVIETPVFPRWVWIEEITYSHIPIATIITAYMVLAPIYEYVGWRRKDPRYDRLARGLIWFALILFSPGAALGTGIPVFIIGTYPEFWSRWSNLFFWPLIAQFVFFTLEVGFLFFAYYLAWDRLANRKPLHIMFGCIAMFWGLSVQFVWDALGGYMLTPGSVPLPEVTDPVGWSTAAFFNPSFPFLFTHRFFGNLSYVMLLTGGVLALRHWRQKDAEQKAYFRWASNLTFTVGFVAFFAQPVVGWFYARVIQAEAPSSFQAIMGGHSATVFTTKFVLIATFLLLGGMYLFVRHRSKPLLYAITVGLAALLILVFLHPPLGWFGERPFVWRGVMTLGIVTLVAVLWLVHGRSDPERPVWRGAMFVAGLAAAFTFALGGFVRENSKGPWTVNTLPGTSVGGITKPEATQQETNRHEAYEKCLPCHETVENTFLRGPNLWARRPRADWGPTVRRELARQGAPPTTEEERQRIIRFLNTYHSTPGNRDGGDAAARRPPGGERHAG